MNVHLLLTPASRSVPGGHQIQCDKTAAALRDLGARVTVGHAGQPLPHSTDVVHWLGGTAADIRSIRNARIPTALSTIYCSRSYRRGTHRGASPSATTARDLRLLLSLGAKLRQGRLVDACFKLFESELSLAQALEAVDVLLPNSPGEADDLRHDFDITALVYPVPNAVDRNAFMSFPADADRPIDVLYVARFEPHKNQLGLVRALRKTGLQVVLAGPDHPHHPTYREHCLRAARGASVQVLAAIPHEKLPNLYRQAKVHVMPSWYETTGLTSLEAAAAGCQVVTTARGHARQYFGELATYCDPADEHSIAAAVERALSSPAPEALRNHIIQHFTWEEAARATLRAYHAVLDGQKPQPPTWPSPPRGASRGTDMDNKTSQQAALRPLRD
jgi:glycosyltransferase involved in cell wall biosynthesis